MSGSNELPLLKSARREAVGALLIWLLVTIYSVGYCCAYGYNRDPKTLTFILGFPDWIFWGIVVPWGGSTIISAVFAFCLMKDDDLDS
jgi:hypothetical protein